MNGRASTRENVRKRDGLFLVMGEGVAHDDAMNDSIIVWFRRNLRLADNPALLKASRLGKIIPVFIDDPADFVGDAQRWWLSRSLQALDADLQARGSRLIYRQGDSATELTALLTETGARSVIADSALDPIRRANDAVWSDFSIDFVNCGTLFAPGSVLNQQGAMYRVFTPFWRKMSQLEIESDDSPALRFMPASTRIKSGAIPAFAPRWSAGFSDWVPGERGAQCALSDFDSGNYAQLRDRPDCRGTSRLSPYLHFGELSPVAVLEACAQDEPFVRQLGWREFAHHLFDASPQWVDAPMRSECDGFAWRDSRADFERWTQGRTGFPLVDAGMRELWATGWMHNRVRMLVASFLVKDLLLPWSWGAEWFESTLLDADVANNRFGWQWVAGCGADAAPYFRVFNPTLQAKKFDPRGEYVRRWVPELGTDAYPAPMLDHAQARVCALERYAMIKLK